MGRLSDDFLILSRNCKNKAMNLKEFLNFAGSRSRALITAACSLPFVFFVPLPGLSIIFGLLVVFAGCSIVRDRPLWIPRFLQKKKIPGNVAAKIFSKGSAILKKIEKVAYPRISFFHRHPFWQKFNGCLVAICGVLLMLPLPPGTNFTPGLNAFLISIGILEEDGLFILAGYFVFLINMFLFIYLPVVGIHKL
nr:protein exod [uncultured bacterium]